MTSRLSSETVWRAGILTRCGCQKRKFYIKPSCICKEIFVFVILALYSYGRNSHHKMFSIYNSFIYFRFIKAFFYVLPWKETGCYITIKNTCLKI